MGQLASRMQLHVDRALASEGITAQQWTVLWLLVNGHASSPADISNYLSIDTGALTRLLDRMVAKKLLIRKMHEKDRRRILLEMTPEAQTLYPRLPAHVAGVLQHFFHDISAEDLTLFKQVILHALDNGDSTQDTAIETAPYTSNDA